jgi:hypothetical protein
MTFLFLLGAAPTMTCPGMQSTARLTGYVYQIGGYDFEVYGQWCDPSGVLAIVPPIDMMTTNGWDVIGGTSYRTNLLRATNLAGDVMYASFTADYTYWPSTKDTAVSDCFLWYIIQRPASAVRKENGILCQSAQGDYSVDLVVEASGLTTCQPSSWSPQ